MNDNLHRAFLPQMRTASAGDPLSIAMPPRAEPRVSPLALVVKRAVDVAASLLLLVLLSPVLLLTALAIRAGGGPALFVQARIGLNGRSFRCYKFRSMVPDADTLLPQLLQRDPALREEWARSQKLEHDPRITPLGSLLRRTSIDELPQLWNVLRGDMSLVGPRPILPSQLDRYGRAARWYLAMRPGITGLWQVTARGDADFARRVSLDCSYVRRYHVLLDLQLLLRTVGVVLSGRGAV